VALGELLDLLSDDYARDILAVTSVRPMSAKQIAEECDMSQPTVYRRAQRLKEFDLLEEQTHVRTGGNDYNVYAATLSEFSMQLAEGSFEASDAHPVGSGDSFVGGFLSQYLTSGSVQEGLEWGAATAALKRSVPGDIAVISPVEVRELIEGETAAISR